MNHVRVLSPALEPAYHVLVQGLQRGAYSGAVALVLQRDELLLHCALGWASVEPAQYPMAPETIFDLASLTKVIATLPSVLLVLWQFGLDLDTPLGAVLPEFGLMGWKRAATLRRLLSHTSGLLAWRPLYLQAHGPEAYLAAIASLEPEAAPGTRVVYSDLNLILLGEFVRCLSGRDIAVFAHEELFAPLGLSDTMFCPPPTLRPRIAATERGNAYERAMVGPAAAAFPRWREDMIWGTVHDGNAFYGLAGVAGHAGLFSTAVNLAWYARLWLQGGTYGGRQLLPAALVAEAIRPQAPGRGLGWARAQDGGLTAPGLSPATYGHTGFTGTALWIDPEQELVIVLLTNRVHPLVREGIAEVRAAFVAAVAQGIAGGTR